MEVVYEESDDFQYFEGQGEEKQEKVEVIPNKTFKKDMNHALRLTNIVANAIGIWPIFYTENESSGIIFQVIMKRLKNAMVYFLLGFLLIPGLLHTIFEDHTSKGKLIKFGSMFLSATGVMKYTLILMREDKVRACLKLVESGWKQAGSQAMRSMMHRNAVISRRLTIATFVTYYAAGVSYRVLRVMLTPSRIGPDGLVYRPMSSPVYGGIFRFNTSASPAYEVIFAVQLLGACTLYCITITWCSYAAVFTTHASSQLDIVMHLLHQLVNSQVADERLSRDCEVLVGKKLKIVVQLHLKILRFIGDVEDLLHKSSLVDMMGTTYVFCIVGYYIVMDVEDKNFFRAIIYTVTIFPQLVIIFNYCYVGQLVTDKTAKVGSSSYMIDWYDLPPKKILYIGMIISISQCPVKLTAGKMLDLSMYNFGTVIKTCFGYINLLHTMNV